MISDLIISHNENVITKLKNLSQITFPADHYYKEIGKSACSYCIVEKIDMKLTHITTINDAAFSDCHSLTEVIFPDTLEFIGENSFGATKLREIYLPNNATNIADSAWNWISTIQSFSVHPENTKYSTEYGSLFNKNKTILYRATNNITNYLDIPHYNELTCVAAFSLTFVPITSFVAAKTLVQIETYTFHLVAKLQILDLTYSQITEMPFFSIRNAAELCVLKCPISLQVMKTNAISLANMKTVVIFPSLNTLDPNVFHDCNNLQSIIYYGVDDFSMVNITSGTTDFHKIHVYTTRLYQYKLFGMIEVERLIFYGSCKCKNSNKLSIRLALFTTLII